MKLALTVACILLSSRADASGPLNPSAAAPESAAAAIKAPALTPEQWTQHELLIRYDVDKRSAGLGFVLGLLLPGGGNFYVGDAQNIVMGSLLLGAVVGGVVLASQPYTAVCTFPGNGGAPECPENTNEQIGRAMVIASWITSPIAGALGAGDYNKRLRKHLGIVAIPDPKHPMLAVAYRF